jgi:hypothetical protein
MASAPFIIIGMHRSGTSFLAKVLERSGIFMGVVKDHNFEAMHVLSLNQQTLWAANYNWHKPGVPSLQFWKTISAKELYREHFKLVGRWAYWKNFIKNPAWGFKDPRNTFTLKMWLSLYPKAKVIYLHRDCNDITKSLQKRNLRKGEVHLSMLDDSAFCQNLCEKYQAQAKSYKEELGANYIEISYQELIQRDKKSLDMLSLFCGKSVHKALEHYLR